MRYDHSEPQAGKDMCDRILCPSIASGDTATEAMLLFLPKNAYRIERETGRGNDCVSGHSPGTCSQDQFPRRQLSHWLRTNLGENDSL